MADYAIHEATLTDIADTIRKKDGTQALIDPADYADRINLMGLLEEDTASGAIAHITDGADEVPIKSLVCDVDANLSGVSAVGVVHTGKNLIDTSSSAWESGTINSSGNNASGSGTRTIGYFDVKGGGTFTLSGVIAPSTNSDFRVFFYDANYDFLSYQGYRTEFTIPDNARYFRIRNISIEDISHMQIEYGTTATTYEPYHAETKTANLGRTIYGGQVDVVNGTAEPTNWVDDTLANLEQGTINGTTGALENSSTRVRSINAVPFPYDDILQDYTFTIPSGYKIAIRPFDANGNFVAPPSWAQAFISNLPLDLIGQGIVAMKFVLAKTDNSAITPSDIAGIGYQIEKGSTATAYSPYFTPFTFTGISANTKLGVNNFWSDGDSQVTYRKMGTQTIITPTLISKSITANGTYNASSDNADGYDSVSVAVPVTPIISESDWNNMTDTEKRTYGLVVIQQASSGYKRGIYVNGADYPVLEEYSDILTTGLSLDVAPDTSHIIECCFYASGYINDGHVCGTTTGNHRNFHVTTYNNMWYFEGDVGKADSQLYPVAGGMDITFRCEGTTAYMNGNNVGTIGRVAGGTSYALAQRGNAITGNNYKYKYFKIWDSNNNLLHDFRFMANKTMIDLVTLATKTYS